MVFKRTGYDTKSVFKRSIAECNLEFFFSKSVVLPRFLEIFSKSSYYDWYQCHFHGTQLFLPSSKVHMFIQIFAFFYFYWNEEVH